MTRLQSSISAVLLGSTFLVSSALADEGFSITLNGQQVAGDRAVAQQVRRTDERLRDADVQISFDGLDTDRRLTLDVITPSDRPGAQVSLSSSLNYKSFVSRSEFLVVDQTGRTVARYETVPGGGVSFARPEGETLFAILRVYDTRGRFDETVPVPLDSATSDRGQDETDTTATQGIPLSGGQVTVTGRDVAPGASVVVMGEPVAADRTGRFVHQRILPVGRHGVDVRVAGGGQNLAFERQVEIPAAQWLYVGTVDLTYGWRRENGGDWQSFDSGRIAFFVDGRTAGGTRITASADSGEGDLADLFSRYGDRDPRSLLLRVDPRDLYPTYGDDSTSEDRTPTSGNLYLRVENDGNYLLWGDFDAQLSDEGYVVSDRSLYGLSGYWATSGQTSHGAPRAQVLAYAAQPDLLPQRDVLRGTGGSVYFLDRQDIARATENLSVQVRDDVTGRVISTQQLVAGRDYDINYVQGVVTLRRPLASGTSGGIVTNGAGDDETVVLVAQYEYRPSAGDVDGYAFGARAEGWITDTLRVGVSGLQDETGASDQTLIGADVTLRFSETAEVRLDVARSEGPGFGEVFSADGGLIFDTEPLASGTGEAIRLEARADWSDLGLAATGGLSFYYEERTEGFSTPDTQVTATTGDETFWGIGLDISPREGLTFALNYEDYVAEQGQTERTGTAEFEAALSDQLTLAGGVEFQDLDTASDVGTRTDVGVRLTYALSESAEIFVFGQKTLERDGLDRNDRAGVGGALRFANGWAFSGDVSDGDGGLGARLLASQDSGDGSSRYIGYELEPDREISGVSLVGRDQGRIVVGGRETVTTDVAIFGENTYDVFGRYRTLTSAYGIDYTPTDAFSTTLAFEVGQIEDDFQNDFERYALTLGLTYDTDQWDAALRFEYRTEDGLRSGSDIKTDTLLLAADIQYRINEDQRLVFSADHARTQTDASPILDGNYTDVVIGYAYRPAFDDRLAVLARYRFLLDEYGQRVDGQDEPGPRQESHVFSIDASYDIDPRWTVGGKLGFRLSETAASATDPYVENDAWLAVGSLRYHALREWDILLEARHFEAQDAGFSETSFLGAAYYQVSRNASIGVGYNFGSFSDDLTDLQRDDEGLFINLVASY